MVPPLLFVHVVQNLVQMFYHSLVVGGGRQVAAVTTILEPLVRSSKTCLPTWFWNCLGWCDPVLMGTTQEEALETACLCLSTTVLDTEKALRDVHVCPFPTLRAPSSFVFFFTCFTSCIFLIYIFYIFKDISKRNGV